MPIYSRIMDSVVGRLRLYAYDEKLVAIAFDNEKDIDYKLGYLNSKFAQPIVDESCIVLEKTVAQLTEYFLGSRKHFTVSVQFRVSEFAQKVLDALVQIPYAQSLTYSDISEKIDVPNSFRAVGNALNHNPIPIIYPCHRVNARNSMTSGYAGGIAAKRRMQELEQTNSLIAKSEIQSEDELINPSLTAYLRSLCADEYENTAMLDYAQQNNVPVSKPETLSLLGVLCTMIKPKRILEIGTAIGYGTLHFAKMCPESQIVSVERDPNMLMLARKNLANLSNITVVECDGVEFVKKSREKFDFIYVDCAKGQYINMYEPVKNMLNKGGAAVYDNVLYKGISANLGVEKHKNRTMVRNLAKFNKTASQDEEMYSSFIAVGDGVLISTRKEQ